MSQKLPKKMEGIPQYFDKPSGFQQGWNACIEEFERLNAQPSKGMVEKDCFMGKPVNDCKGCPDCMGIVGEEGSSELDEIEKTLVEHITCHLKQGTHIPLEDIEPAIRLIMISVRQEVFAKLSANTDELSKQEEDRLCDFYLALGKVKYKDDDLLKEFETFVKPLFRRSANTGLVELDREKVIDVMVDVLFNHHPKSSIPSHSKYADAICKHFGAPPSRVPSEKELMDMWFQNHTEIGSSDAQFIKAIRELLLKGREQ